MGGRGQRCRHGEEAGYRRRQGYADNQMSRRRRRGARAGVAEDG